MCMCAHVYMVVNAICRCADCMCIHVYMNRPIIQYAISIIQHALCYALHVIRYVLQVTMYAHRGMHSALHIGPCMLETVCSIQHYTQCNLQCTPCNTTRYYMPCNRLSTL